MVFSNRLSHNDLEKLNFRGFEISKESSNSNFHDQAVHRITDRR